MTALNVLIVLVVGCWFLALWLICRDLQRLAVARRELAQRKAWTTTNTAASDGDDDPGPLHFSQNIDPIVTKAQKRRQRRAKR